MPEFLLPLGPFHILLLHLPIGILCAIGFIELCMRSEARAASQSARTWLNTLLLMSTAGTILLGLAYAKYGNYQGEVDDHLWWGLLFGWLVLGLFCFHWAERYFNSDFLRNVYLLNLALAAAAMAYSSHLGGSLVHGEDFLTKPFLGETSGSTEGSGDRPEGLELDEAVELFEAAHLVFERQCVECHGSTKEKGNYRIDLAHRIREAGKSEHAAITPGDPSASELYRRMSLPHGHKDLMPPEEKAPVAAKDIESVRLWIDAGAYWPSQAEQRAVADTHVERGTASMNQVIEQINKTGAKAEYTGWDADSIRVDLGVVTEGELTTALEALHSVADKVQWLDASNLELPEDFYKALPKFTRIERLHLDGSNVRTQDLKALESLENLNYLNLYRTELDDKALNAIAQLKSLKKLYLSGTKLTPTAVEKFKKQNPDIVVIYRE